MSQLSLIPASTSKGTSNIPEEELGRIQSATHSDMALGNERFKEEIEKLTGRRVMPRKRGRKPSQID
ncbi:hypothetical protein [Marinomonas sp.]|uniref:hypothetical protein n=1 Tax=Marinomonas sp. TaxID=1904862 RepID=UPI003BAB1D73